MRIEAKVIAGEDSRGNFTFSVDRTTKRGFLWANEHISRFTVKGNGGTFFSPSSGYEVSYAVAFACIAAKRVYQEESDTP